MIKLNFVILLIIAWCNASALASPQVVYKNVFKKDGNYWYDSIEIKQKNSEETFKYAKSGDLNHPDVQISPINGNLLAVADMKKLLIYSTKNTLMSKLANNEADITISMGDNDADKNREIKRKITYVWLDSEKLVINIYSDVKIGELNTLIVNPVTNQGVFDPARCDPSVLRLKVNNDVMNLKPIKSNEFNSILVEKFHPFRFGSLYVFAGGVGIKELIDAKDLDTKFEDFF